MLTRLPPLDELLACPVDGTPLLRDGAHWISEGGRRYPTIQGIPVLFHADATDTMPAMAQSRVIASLPAPVLDDPWCVETLGLYEEDKMPLLEAHRSGQSDVDPVVAQLVAATCGNLYRGLIGRLPRYPIPEFRLKTGRGSLLVDLGCNWGRWCIAASREGFLPIGIDPQLGAVLAAQRVAKQLGVEAHFICADARHLPLRDGVADVVFSYSVLQHLSREDVAEVVAEANRVIRPGGRLFAQMPNVVGLRCLYQWARRGFGDGTGFDVRYWTLPQLRRAFGVAGSVAFEIDCFFGIGLQPSDADLMPTGIKLLLGGSEGLRWLGHSLPGLAWVADSVYVDAQKAGLGP